MSGMGFRHDLVLRICNLANDCLAGRGSHLDNVDKGSVFFLYVAKVSEGVR
jgi:hypothetical protein